VLVIDASGTDQDGLSQSSVEAEAERWLCDRILNNFIIREVFPPIFAKIGEVQPSNLTQNPELVRTPKLNPKFQKSIKIKN